MIDSVSGESFLWSYASRKDSIEASETTIQTSNAALNVLQAIDRSLDYPEYLCIEKEADAAKARGLEKCWTNCYDYAERCFFHDIEYQYGKAYSLAMKANDLQSAARILEKQAWICEKKTVQEMRAFYLVRLAWDLYKQIGDEQKIKTCLTKLHVLIDNKIAVCRTEYAESADTLDLSNLIHALLCKADLLEVLGFTIEAQSLYEEAGQFCMTIEDEGTAYGQLSAALIAGLCFEKSQKTEELARICYGKVLEMKEQIETIFMEEDVAISAEEQLEEEDDDTSTNEHLGTGLYKTLYFAPACLQVSLASLKCGRNDLFTEIITCQLQLFISFLQLRSEDQKAIKELKMCAVYMKALLNVSETILGSNALAEIKTALEKVIDFKSEEKIWGNEVEKALLGIYTAPKEVSVNEMIERLEDRKYLLCP